MNKHRCVVWLAWGAKYVAEAAESRRSISALGPRDPARGGQPGLKTCLITDAESAARIAPGTFDHVVTAKFALTSYLRKCELWRWLPAEYDSFLFLDVDTRVIGDITLGFDKAEQYGIAMAQAPRYSLERFSGFDEIMRAVGMTPRGQLQFNSGVIFFARRPGVEAVMQEWDALARRFGDPTAGKYYDLSMTFGDQPYLTLAMEMLDFNPYALSTSFNHRGKGELIDGDVRIWHSYKSVPADLNAQPNVPYRYVRDGRVRLMTQGRTIRKQLLRRLRKTADRARALLRDV